jgi:hypothetical protein
MPSAHYVHPEFGYFCPGLGLRRVLRVAAVLDSNAGGSWFYSG